MKLRRRICLLDQLIETFFVLFVILNSGFVLVLLLVSTDP